MGVRRFEELVAWRFCTELCDAVLQAIADGTVQNDPEFSAQIRDAAESAPALIAEGFVRFTTGEFIRYLRMARGELGEIQNCLLRASRSNYFSTEETDRLTHLSRRAMGTTTNLLKAKIRQQTAEEKAQRSRKRQRRAQPPR